jgi:hypothetical protein
MTPRGNLKLPTSAYPFVGRSPYAQVVLETAADARPVGIERSNGHQVGQVHLLNEVGSVIEQLADVSEALGIDAVDVVDVEGTRRAAHEVVRVRVLAAEDRVDLDQFLLPLQGLEVVSDTDQVHLRRELVGGMSPVGIGEDAELSGFDETREALLEVGEVAHGTLRPAGDLLRQIGGGLGVGLERAHDVDPVERMQVVEVDHVVLHVLRAEHQVAHEFSGGRHGDAERILNRADRRERVHRGADAAGTFGEGPGIPRIAALENQLEAADHGARGEGIDDLPVLDFGLDAEMAFDARDGIDNNAVRHFRHPPFLDPRSLPLFPV